MRVSTTAWGRAIGLALLLTGVQPAIAAAQAEAVLTGRVVAEADGSSIGSARLTVKSPGSASALQTVTGPDGRFALHALPAGRVVMAIDAPGFQTRELELTLKPREVRTVTVSLELRGIEASVDVTGSAGTSASTHSPSSTVLGTDRLERLSAGEQANLPEAIVHAAPGMIRGHDDLVHVRGHEVALNPIVNGVSFWENPHSLFSAGLSPEVIDTVNIMTGGFPAEYGNRFGGVLDIVTKSGLRMEDQGSVTVVAGQAGRRTLSGEFGGHGRRVGYFAFGSVAATDRFLSPPSVEAIHDEAIGARGHVQVDAVLGESGTLRGLATGDGTNFDIPVHPRDVQLRPAARARQRTRQQSAILGWTRAWPATLLDVTLYQRWSISRLLPAAGPLTATAALERELGTLGARINVTRSAGAHAFKAGVEGVRLSPAETLSYDDSGYRDLTHLLGLPHVHFAAGAVSFAGRDTGGQVSAYVQDTVAVGRRVSLNVGARVDHHDLVVSATRISPRVNLAVQASGETTLHASYNRFFVPPPVEGVLSSSAGLTAAIREIGRALPSVEPTAEDQFEVGAGTGAGPVRLSVTGYYRSSDRPVHTTVWPDSRIYSYASFERGRAYGLETKAEIPRLARYGLTGYVNYALGRVDFWNPVLGGFITEAAHVADITRFPAPMDQRHTLSAGATYRHARSGAWLGGTLEYGSGTPRGHGGGEHEHGDGEADHGHATSDQPTRVPAHTTLNLSAGVDLLRRGGGRGRVTLQVDVENFTNDVYLIAQEGEFSPAQYSIPRLITARVKLRF